MNIRNNLISLGLFILLFTTVASNAEEQGGEIKAQEKEIPGVLELVSLNLQDTDINLLLELYSKFRGITIVKDDQVRGKVTVISPIKLPKDEAIRIIEASLELRGFTILEMDGFAKVLPQKDATRKSIRTMTEGLEAKPEDKMVTQVIPLKHIEARTIIANLQLLISPNGNVFASDKTNTLVITDIASNIKRLIEIIAQLDVEISAGKLEVRVIPLKFADETELADVLNKIFTSTDAQASAVARQYTRTVVRRPQVQQPTEAEAKNVLEDVLGKVKIIPYERLHALVIITTSEYFRIVQSLIMELDVEGIDKGAATRVYFLQNAKAKDVSTLLNTLFGGITETQTTEGARVIRRYGRAEEEAETTGVTTSMEGKIKMVADERTNALIVTTSPKNFSLLESLLKEIDLRSPQVLIEAWIVEVTLNDAVKYGVEWKFFEEHTIDSKGYSSTGKGGFGLQDFSLSTAPQGLSYWLLKDNANIGAFLNMLAEVTKVNINSTPRILTSNNKEAIIRVGQDVPIVKDIRFDTLGNPVFSYEYREVGIKLTVTPSINNERDVALNVKQEIETIIGEFTDPTNPPTFGAREAQTSVVVKNGQTIIIGGLIKDDKTKTTSKIPIVGDIPLLGLLFRSQNTTTEKTELMVFITPTVIYTPEEAEEMTRSQEAKAEISPTPSQEKAKLHYENGMMHYKRGDYGLALSEWEKAQEAKPNYKDTDERIKSTREKIDALRHVEIEEEKKKEEKIRATRVKEYYNKGKSYYNEKNYTEAIYEMQKVLALEPGHKSAMRHVVLSKEKLRESVKVKKGEREYVGEKKLEPVIIEKPSLEKTEEMWLDEELKKDKERKEKERLDAKEEAEMIAKEIEDRKKEK